MRNYLTNRLQLFKINNSFSEWTKISAGALQGFVLGPLLFHFFIKYIFLFLQKFKPANYVDDSTMYASHKCVSKIADSLRHEFTILSKWLGSLSDIW